MNDWIIAIIYKDIVLNFEQIYIEKKNLEDLLGIWSWYIWEQDRFMVWLFQGIASNDATITQSLIMYRFTEI